MAGRNGSRLRVVVLVGGLLGLAVSLAAIGVALRGRGLAGAANVAQLVSVVLGAPSLAIGLVVWWRRSSAPAAAPGSKEILRAKDVLAGLVAEQWKAEATIRALDDPDPIPVRWRTPQQAPTAATALMDHRANIEPDTGKEGEAWWTASSADIAALADRFRRTRRGRLVILGGAGMGKTTLAMQLLLHLLETHTPDEPIPVLLPVAGWDTEQFSRLHDWLANQLARDYPALRSPELGIDLVRALTGRGHILPVLDGLDELPPPARAKMIAALNSSIGGDQLILTSRTAEFTAAVTEAGDVVTSAAVLEPLPLTPAVAADYLTRWLPPSPSSGWQQILTDLRSTSVADQAPHGTALSGPGAVLAAVVATPLGLWLLRSVYSTPGTDPSELCDPARFPNPAVMQAHLFDQIIPALITARPASADPGDLFRPRRYHDPAHVRRYLGYLADIPTANNQTGTRDFAWWQLARHTLNPHTLRLCGFAAGLMIGLIIGLVGGLLGGLSTGSSFGLAGWLVASSWLKQTPGFANLAKRPPSLSGLIRGGPAIALVFGLVFGLGAGLGGGLATGLGAGFSFGLGAGLVGGIIQWFETPTPADQASTPLIAWRADRSLNLLRTIVGALVGGLVGGLSFGLVGRPEVGLVIGLASGLAGGLGAGRHHAWLVYLVATNLLAWRRLLPRRLMPFVDDMHRLGLLRAVGPIYQFRHAELQDHLAAAYRSHGRPRAQRNAVATGAGEQTGR